MRLILNILWFIFGGWISGTLWLLAAAVFAITIVGLPFVPAIFRLASLAYWPFGRVVVDRDNGVISLGLNVIWFILAGWWLAIHHLVLAVGLAVTLIGIPFAWQHIKMAMLALIPVGKTIRDV